MAWFRLPRSIRTYLIVGLVITCAILTFSTSKMLRVDASDSKSNIPFVLTQHSSTGGSGMGLQTSNYNQELSSTMSDERRLDFHTTVAGATSPSGAYDQSSTLQKSSDTIVITPSSLGRSSTEGHVDQRNPNTSNDSQPLIRHHSLRSSRFYVPTMSNYSSFSRKSSYPDPSVEFRRNHIKDMMKHAWNGYATYAWGFNELRPVSRAPHTESVFGSEKLGATIVDGIDTLFIMGLDDEYQAARSWIEQNLNFDEDLDLSVFETNIRYVGGLLSIYSLTKDQMFLNKAIRIADKLLPAFDSPSGIPRSTVNIRNGYSRNHDWAYGAAILSEFGSMHLEFVYLSYLTRDPKYKDKVMKIRDVIKRAVPRSDGLYNNYMNTESGQWLTRPTHISMGALGDSFYEYLIKAYVQSNGEDKEAYELYMRAMEAFENKLIFISGQSRLTYFAEIKDTAIVHKMDSLACFSGGMLALGASKSPEPLKTHHFQLGKGIADTCRESCSKAQCRLGPETFLFTNRVEAMAYGPSEKYYILRPEIVESYFYMWRYTHDPKYRDWAWDFAQALDKYCKVDAGYSGIRNVYLPVAIHDDVQQSFFFAEVLKYLYLIFSEDDVISLDDWIFNTEAHPFPIMKQN